jgi:hypothetical protein
MNRMGSMREVLRFFFSERPRMPTDRESACEAAAAELFQVFVSRMEATGWASDEVAAALVSLALKHMQRQIEATRDESHIAEA